MEALFGDGTEVREAHPLRRVALRTCYGLKFSWCRSYSLNTVGDLKADSTHSNLTGKCALVRLGLIRMASAEKLDADAADAHPFFEKAMHKLREPRVPAAAAAAPEAAAESSDLVEDPLEAWVRCMISPDHCAMATDIRNPRKTIKAHILKALAFMYDRMLRLAPTFALRTWMPPPSPAPSPLPSRRGFFVHAGVSKSCPR